MNLLPLEPQRKYKAIRTVFKNYYSLLVYQSEVFGETNAHKYFSVDESLFCIDENKKQSQLKSILKNIYYIIPH